ncbi:MAG: sulfite exporter TauE/SafE family protein [Candidatus Limnocylindrales bacterium]
MSPIEALAIFAAGLAAGTINTIVGSGSLVTFPTLLAFGYSPVLANVSNTVGLVPGSLSGAIGYRRELTGQRSRMIRLGIAAAAGGLTGGLLLLALPASSFERVIPFLILGSVVLVALGPRLSRAMGARRAIGEEHTGPLVITLYLTGIYGGYFGAGQGVIMMAILSVFLPDDLQRLNALKNVLAVLINGVAAVLFILFSPIAWPAAILLAIGATIGGQVGALVGRRLPANVLRGAIIVIGTIVGVRLLLG